MLPTTKPRLAKPIISSDHLQPTSTRRTSCPWTMQPRMLLALVVILLAAPANAVSSVGPSDFDSRSERVSPLRPTTSSGVALTFMTARVSEFQILPPETLHRFRILKWTNYKSRRGQSRCFTTQDRCSFPVCLPRFQSSLVCWCCSIADVDCRSLSLRTLRPLSLCVYSKCCRVGPRGGPLGHGGSSGSVHGVGS
jgi:hypothetical protein